MAAGVTAPLPARRRVPWNPLACSDTEMRPNILLMAKLTWLLLVVGGFDDALLAPYSLGVGLLKSIPGEGQLLFGAFWIGGFCLLFNRVVRAAAVLVGGVALLAPFESLPAWHPFAWVGGCVLVLVALQGANDNPRFLRWLLVLIHGAALLGALHGAGWVASAFAPAWSPTDYAGSLPRRLVGLASTESLVHGFKVASVAVCGAITLGMVIPRLRRLAAWLAILFYTALYLALGAKEILLFGGAIAVAQIAVFDWPRFVIVVWPRSCGWSLRLRKILDRYDFEKRTDWPRPPDPDAELEAWFDLKPFAGAKAVLNLFLVFPVFYFALLVGMTAIHALLPAWVGVPVNSLIVLALLGFSVAANLGSLRARVTHRPPPPMPGEAEPANQADFVVESAATDMPTIVAERGADENPSPAPRRPPDPPEIIIDIDTPPPADR